MAHIQCPTNYIPLQQVTAANLNAHVNNATLQPGAITDHLVLSGSLESGDAFLVHDASTTSLKQIAASNVLASGLPVSSSAVTTSTITGTAGANINITAPTGYATNINGVVTTALSVNGNGAVTGSLTVTGPTTTVDLSSSGTANFTGTLQVNGEVGYVLTEIIEELIPTSSPAISTSTWTDIWTSSSYVKPVGEIWMMELVGNFYYSINTQMGFRFIKTVDTVFLDSYVSNEGGGSAYWHYDKTNLRYIWNAASSFTASTFKLQCVSGQNGYTLYWGLYNPSTPVTWNWNSNVTFAQPILRIYKYKTA